MKKITVLIFSLLLPFVSAYSQKAETDSIMNKLYETWQQRDEYVAKKEKQIADTKKLLIVPDLSQEQIYFVNEKLREEYRTFISDSAIMYAQRNIEIAHQLKNKEWLYESQLHLSTLYSLAMLFVEASDILRSIPVKELSPELHIQYFKSYRVFYFYYSHESEYYKQYYDFYRDSLLNMLDKNTSNYKTLYASKLVEQQKIEEARKILLDEYNKVQGETRQKAILAYEIGYTYLAENNPEMQKKYFAISAIVDIKNAIKENASLLALAKVLYQINDIDNAYLYIKQSIDDADFSNYHLRTMEISHVFPVIEKAYQNKVQEQNHQLYIMLFCICVLSLLLIFAVLYVYKQMKKLTLVRESLKDMNEELQQEKIKLKKLNDDLLHVNDEMNRVNRELSESNFLKDEYIVRYMNQSSVYLDKLENYQKILAKTASSKKIEELFQLIKSKQFLEDELKEFYTNFDNSFLHLFPHFIEELNALLFEDKQLTPKQNELLNTELRIFALIRLGITDSTQIANFLRYPVTTIYNYRAKVRSKAISRDNFEIEIMKIGIIDLK